MGLSSEQALPMMVVKITILLYSTCTLQPLGVPSEVRMSRLTTSAVVLKHTYSEASPTDFN